ncbi:ATP-dependent RNA helicase dbp7, partial [Spiromyces aspiralis]
MDANGDDLLLNITPQLAGAAGSKGPQPQAVRVSVGRTGRWKERVKQKRLLKQKINRALRDASEPDVLPALRTGSGGRDTTGNLSNKPPPKVHYNPVEDNDLSDSGGSQQAQIIKQKHVVSSLFTRNPEIPGELTNGDYMDQPTAAKISSNAVIDESSFEGLQLDIDLARHLASKLGITKPTEIQRRVIPYMIGRTTLDSATKGTVTVCPNHNQRGEGLDRDILIQAETGSGKTLAYLLPILHRLLLASTIQPESKDSAEPNRDLGTLAIVLTPTRELAQQVYEVAESLLRLPFTQYCEKNDEDNGDKPNSRRHYRKRWMVPGI